MIYSKYNTLMKSFIIVTLALIAGCTYSVPTLQFRKPGTLWRVDTEDALVSNDSVVVAFELRGLDQNRWVFSLDIKNETSSPVLVDPATFFYTHDPIAVNTGGNLVGALNPESELRRIEARRAEVHEAYVKDQGVTAVFSLLDLFFDLATIRQSKTIEEQEAEEIEDLEEEVQELEDRENYRKKMDRLDQERLIWEEKAVQRTNLEPGQGTSGLVYFPVRQFDGKLEIQLPFLPYRYLQQFKQVTIKAPL